MSIRACNYLDMPYEDNIYLRSVNKIAEGESFAEPALITKSLTYDPQPDTWKMNQKYKYEKIDNPILNNNLTQKHIH